MSDLINRQALRDAMYHEAFETDTEMQRWDSGCWIRYKLFENCIDSMPTIEPEQQKGEWRPIVLTSYPPKYREMCSCCGFMKNKEAFRFCPICGAKMRGEDDEIN